MKVESQDRREGMDEREVKFVTENPLSNFFLSKGSPSLGNVLLPPKMCSSQHHSIVTP